MFTEMQTGTAKRIAAMKPQYEKWLTEQIPTDNYQHWWAIWDEEIWAGAGFGLQAWQPTARDAQLVHAYIDNVYTLPIARRQGLARRLLQYLLSEGRAQGIQVFKLHASPGGQILYQRLGFETTSEMRLNFE